ncbi:N-succinylarginine dihydrolase [Shigella sonnei]
MIPDVPLSARQTREASEAVARLNQVNPQQVIFAQQNPTLSSRAFL